MPLACTTLDKRNNFLVRLATTSLSSVVYLVSLMFRPQIVSQHSHKNVVSLSYSRKDKGTQVES